MKYNYTFIVAAILGISLLFTSCLNDLDVKPLDPQSETADKIYSVEGNYIKGLMKVYSILAISGQDGAGSSDIDGVDAGNAQLYRTWWNMQVIPTDEAICAWAGPNDIWAKELNEMKWTASYNETIEGLYQRCLFTIALANDYLKETTDSKMSERGISPSFQTTVHGYRSEARFVRALSYYMLMDAYGRPPFITESNFSLQPEQIDRDKLFDWIESELKDLANVLPAPRTKYGRADQAVANTLLSRMYLNAKVYTGRDRYTDCITASKAVIDAGYTLVPTYANIFKADNDKTSASEIIFPIVYNGTSTESYGGTTYLICASRGGTAAKPDTDGIQYGWGGNRARSSFVKKFEFGNPDYAQDQDAASILDKRGIFLAEGKSLEIINWRETFDTEGWSVYKYSNVTSDGVKGSNLAFPDTDVPFFRLAEVYLNYVEAMKRGGTGGNEANALTYVNDLRQRGYGVGKGTLNSYTDITLPFLLDERCRELYWEAVRRTDLIRYDMFTTSAYLWPFKGGAANGTNAPSYMNLYPISLADISVNVNLTQNTGY